MKTTLTAASVFQSASVTAESVLGWTSMPAFGQTFAAAGQAGTVAEWVAENRTNSPAQPSLLDSFWSVLSVGMLPARPSSNEKTSL